jgi:hypothetical protein
MSERFRFPGYVCRGNVKYTDYDCNSRGGHLPSTGWPTIYDPVGVVTLAPGSEGLRSQRHE